MPFCEVEVATGTPPDIRVNFNNTSGASDCPPDKFDAINPQELAQRLRVDRVVLNPRRHWVMDQFTISGIGETKDFEGVRATWIGSIALKDFFAAGSEPFTPFETNRAPSRNIYVKGKPVFSLTPPDGKTAYIVQSYTDHVDKGLTMDKLPQLGNLFRLPAGWRFKVKDLDSDLTIAPLAPNYTAHSLVDNLLNVCAGLALTLRANTFPSLRPSVTTSRS